MADVEFLTLERLIDIQKKLGLDLEEVIYAFMRSCEFHGTRPALSDEAAQRVQECMARKYDYEAGEQRI